MIAIIDYDAGNLKSVEKALLYLGQDVLVTRDREKILSADKVILPGVGNFGDAMEKLKGYGLEEVIRETARQGKPFLGICLGLQLLFERSAEAPGVEGLGILKGEILRIPDREDLKVPHIGWNSLKLQNQGGGRSADCEGSDGIRSPDRRLGGERQCVCLPVPSGKKQPHRS